VPSVAADELDDAVARRKAAEKEIAERRPPSPSSTPCRQRSRRTSRETSQALREVNADRPRSASRSRRWRFVIAKVEAAYEGLVTKLGC
jgi:hypothetical protein